jgi:hypothetical protein
MDKEKEFHSQPIYKCILPNEVCKYSCSLTRIVVCSKKESPCWIGTKEHKEWEKFVLGPDSPARGYEFY